jgi:hypothetical protein
MSMEAASIGPVPGAGRNARVSHIRKFVCSPANERCAVLRLVAVEDPPTTLGEWPRVACEDNGSTAEDVDALLREHTQTAGREVIANLVWQSHEGHVVYTKRLRCVPDATQDPGSMAQAEAAGLDGSRRADDMQRQREHEAAMRCYFSAHQTQSAQAIALMREQRELVVALGGMLREQYIATHQANVAQDRLREERRRELDEAAIQLREATDVEAGAEESGARAQLIRMVGDALTQALPLIVNAAGAMMLKAQAQTANTNATDAQVSAAAAE